MFAAVLFRLTKQSLAAVIFGNLFNQNQFVTSHTTIPEKICRSNHPHPLLTLAHIQRLDSIKKKGYHTTAKVYAFGL